MRVDLDLFSPKHPPPAAPFRSRLDHTDGRLDGRMDNGTHARKEAKIHAVFMRNHVPEHIPDLMPEPKSKHCVNAPFCISPLRWGSLEAKQVSLPIDT